MMQLQKTKLSSIISTATSMVEEIQRVTWDGRYKALERDMPLVVISDVEIYARLFNLVLCMPPNINYVKVINGGEWDWGNNGKPYETFYRYRRAGVPRKKLGMTSYDSDSFTRSINARMSDLVGHTWGGYNSHFPTEDL